MLRKTVRPIADSFDVSPADILFGDGALFRDESLPRALPRTIEHSGDWLARAELALRKSQLSECQRCVSQALRCFSQEARALTAEEWLFLAGIALLNDEQDSAIHRITMARHTAQRQNAVDSGSELRLRILILQSVITGVSSPEVGRAELQHVFQSLARHRCPSLCRQALLARRLLLEWNQPGSSAAWWNSLNIDTERGVEPLNDFTELRGPELRGPSNPEWN